MMGARKILVAESFRPKRSGSRACNGAFAQRCEPIKAASRMIARPVVSPPVVASIHIRAHQSTADGMSRSAVWPDNWS